MKAKQLSLQDKYNSFLNEVLKERLFESAINLNQLLVDTFTVSADNARQIVKRAVSQKTIKSSSPYTFGKKQYIYIYNEYELDKLSIKTITEKTRPPIFRLLELMDQNNGIISYYEGLKITASPLENSSTKVSSLDDILNLLMKLDLVYQKRDNNNVVYILYKHNKETLSESIEEFSMASHYSKMVIDCSVLPDILRWLGKSNLIGNSNAIYRNKKTPAIGAKHNNLVWDAFAYTRATGINLILGSKADTIEKQTLVVLDVVLSSEYSQIHLDAFYSRIQINRNSVEGDERKILPIIIYQSCPEHTINKISKLGIITFDISAIFGTRIYDILNKTQELSGFFKETKQIDRTIESILKTISSAGQDDALKELRGTLFEFLMFPLLSSIYPLASIDRAKTLTRLNDNGKKESYEYDYIIQSSNPPEIVFVELKGYNSGATIPLGDSETKASLKWFFKKTLPFAIKEFQTTIEKGRAAKAVYITTASFWDDGKEFLTKMDKSKFKSVLINTGYDRDTLLKLLKERGFENEIRIIKKFYTREEE
ncbi:hypothetical protein [Flavobacterium sp. PL002]|uniref:hypothetical protein n=1 Tax=Flavobacterium sp. PL002 TaxID=1897058 RepID=UPI001788969A|nr:hypothetical protein [Flavobacterium sp. PL002]MBE0392183.1 hypothetical protein [Flavobacterium sp. PL002]